MVEGGGLENRCAARHRGFESPLLRERALCSYCFIGITALDGLLTLERAYGNLKVAYRVCELWRLLALAHVVFLK